ncbi:Filamin-C [Halotydeus destructor]|nr:Filamin-C [Halotydeus destructor]
MGRADDVDPKKCSAVGGGVDQGVTGKPLSFTVTGMLGQIQLLAVTIEGPSQPTLNKVLDDHQDVVLSYTPQLPGDYVIHIKVKDKAIKNSPCNVTIIGDGDPKYKKVALIECTGKGIITGKINTQNEFWVDARAAELTAGLTVNIRPPERASCQLDIQDMKNGTFKIHWKPTCSGLYVINVKVEGVHVPSSPFYVRAN